jgi:hypothetical protein
METARSRWVSIRSGRCVGGSLIDGMINGMINELSIDDRVITWCAADNTTDRVVEHVGHRTAHRLGAIALAPSITRAASSTRGVSAIPQLPIRTTQTARPLSRTGH